MGDSFYRSEDPTNSIIVLTKKATKENPEKQRTQNTHYIYIQNTQQREIHIKHSKSPSLH